MSDFFETPPPLPEPKRPAPRPWWGPPRASQAGIVPLELVLARTEKFVVYITHLEAYPTGFEFDVYAVAASNDNGLDLEIFGRHWPRAGQKRDQLPPELLRIGVEFPDGGRATSLDPPRPGLKAPSAPAMTPRAGHGGSRSWSQGYWVWPLPQPGELQFVCEWPAAEIPLTRVGLDSQRILDAAQRARVIFAE